MSTRLFRGVVGVPLSIRPASREDLPLLVDLRRRLIEDQRSRYQMTASELESHVGGWFDGSWSVMVATQDQTVVGYAVFHLRPDGHNPPRENVHLWQFYVDREYRNRGPGRAFSALLRAEHFPPTSIVTLDVLATNPGGFRFWSRLGFQPDRTTLELPAEEIQANG